MTKFKKAIHNILKKSLLILARTVLMVITLLVAITLILQIPSVQNLLADKVLERFAEDMDTEIRLERISIVLPNSVALKNFYVEGTDKDTLLEGESIRVKVSLFDLLRDNITFKSIALDNVHARMIREVSDSSFNYEFAALRSENSREKHEAVDTSKNSSTFLESISVNRIILRDIDFLFDDGVSGSTIHAKLGNFRGSINRFSLKEEIIDIHEVGLNEASLYLKTTEKKVEEGGDFNFQIVLDRPARVENAEIRVDDRFTGMDMRIAVGRLIADPEQINIPDKQIAMHSVRLESSSFNMFQRKLGKEDSLRLQQYNLQKINSPFDWQISAQSVDLYDNEMKLYTNPEVPGRPGIDFQQLHITSLSAGLYNIEILPDNYKVNIASFAFQEQSGFELERLYGFFRLSEQQAIAEQIEIRTSSSHIKNTSRLSFTSLQELGSDPSSATIHIQFDESEISMEDILYFNPELANQGEAFTREGAFFGLSGLLEGSLDSLSLRGLQTNYMETTKLALAGRVKGLPQFDRINIDVQIDSLVTGRKDIELFLPDTAISGNLQLPEHFFLEGNYKGTLNNFDALVDIQSSQGVARIETQYRKDSLSDIQTYTARLDIPEYDLGKLMDRPDTLGKVKLSGQVEGNSKDFKEFDLNLQVDIDTFGFLQYPYSNLQIQGNYRERIFDGIIRADDPNLVFNFEGSLNARDSIPDGDFLFQLEGADLMALNLTREDLRIAGTIDSDFSGNHLDNLNGNLTFRDLIFLQGNDQYDMDSLTIEAINKSEEIVFDIQSELLTAHFEGNVKLGELDEILQPHLFQYMNLEESEITATRVPRHFQFDMNFQGSELLAEVLMPDLKKISPVSIHATFDQETHNLRAEIIAPALDYGGIELDSFSTVIQSDANQLTDAVNRRLIAITDLMIRHECLNATASHERMQTRLTLSVVNEADRYHIEASMTREQQDLLWKLRSDSLILNYNSWVIDDEHMVRVTDSTVYFDNMNLEHAAQGFSIANATLGEDPSLEFTFSAFKINTLTAILNKGARFITGELNGKMNLFTQIPGPAFTSDLIFRDIKLLEESLFETIQINASKKTAPVFELHADFLGELNSLQVEGNYQSELEENSVNASLDIEKLDFGTIKHLLGNQFTTMKGILSGSLEFSGSIASPSLKGTLDLKETEVNPVYLNTPFYIDNQQIEFEGKRIVFKAFSIEDVNRNRFGIDGHILFEQVFEPVADLEVRTDNFTFLNTKKENEQLFYGKLISEIFAEIDGRLSQAEIRVNSEIKNGSDFYFILPEGQAPSISKEGLVEFIEEDGFVNTVLAPPEGSDNTLYQNSAISLQANISIVPEALFTLVVDPLTGEELKVQGDADLSLTMNPSRPLSLTGRYEISNGHYNLLLYDVIRRRFDIVEGSTIIWSGDPLQANADISARYEVRTSPAGLIGNQVSDMSNEEYQTLNNRLPFQVFLNMEGTLVSPQIDFDLRIPPAARNALVESKLAQLNENESELNKQVFSLLVFKDFIRSNPGDAPVSYRISETARTSISNMLSQQLNQFADRHIEGFQINVDISSYARPEAENPLGRTQVQLDVRKEFFNERLSVQVGRNIEVSEYERERNMDPGSIAGDVIVEYSLNEVGSLKLQAFNKTEYEDVIDGVVRKTGVAFIISRDFYTIKGLMKDSDRP